MSNTIFKIQLKCNLKLIYFWNNENYTKKGLTKEVRHNNRRIFQKRFRILCIGFNYVSLITHRCVIIETNTFAFFKNNIHVNEVLDL